jgi:ATP-binding cassette subfamily C protein
LLVLLIVVLLLGFFEVVGIASVLPFMEMLSKKESITTNKNLIWLYENINFGNYQNLVIALGGFIIATITLANLLGILSQYMRLTFSWNLAHRMSVGLLKVYAQKPYSYYLKQNTSDLRAYILNEVASLTSKVILPVIEFISQAIVCTIILVLLLMVSPLTTLTMGGVLGGAYALIYILRQRSLKRLGQDRIDSNINKYKYLEEMLSGIKTVKTYSAQTFFEERFAKESLRYSQIQPKVQMTYATPKYILEIVAMGGVLMVTMYLYLNSGDFLKSLPRMTLYAIAGYRLLPAMQKVFASLAKLKHSMPSLHRLYDDLITVRDMPEIDEEVKADITPLPFHQNIEMSGINFKYDEDGPQILKNLNVGFNKGDMVAFVGSTGSGKTTLVDIFTGLLTADSGKLKIDGVEVNADNTEQWQKNIAYVPQDVYLYDDTIKANITFGHSNHRYNEDSMMDALKMAGIYDFIINELPEGINTVIGERGVRLSGGQRQRLGLARALYSKPSVLVLDEATSALDNITEKGIIESLLSLPEEITTVMIAHRLSTVQYADTIFILDSGNLVGQGSYYELIKSNDVFKEMDEITSQKKSGSSVVFEQ